VNALLRTVTGGWVAWRSMTAERYEFQSSLAHMMIWFMLCCVSTEIGTSSSNFVLLRSYVIYSGFEQCVRHTPGPPYDHRHLYYISSCSVNLAQSRLRFTLVINPGWCSFSNEAIAASSSPNVLVIVSDWNLVESNCHIPMQVKGRPFGNMNHWPLMTTSVRPVENIEYFSVQPRSSMPAFWRTFC
jgi:hypothetical protein